MVKILLIASLLFSGCAVTHTAIIYCPSKANVDNCIKDQLGKVKVLQKVKIDNAVYMVDYQ